MSRHHSAAEYVAALTASGGLVKPAARALGKSRQAVYDAAARHPEVRQALEDARAELLDLCELAVFQAVRAGDIEASKFVLEHLGKHRGWGRPSRARRRGGPKVAPIDVERLSDAELEALRA